jgi:transcriptional regulator with XRE-family HTH domain
VGSLASRQSARKDDMSINLSEVNRAEVARATGLSPSGVSRILLGRRNSRINTLVAVARVLDVSIDDLLFAIEKEKEKTSGR